MTERTKTQDNLSVLQNRNQGRRKSLLVDNEYSSKDNSTSPPESADESLEQLSDVIASELNKQPEDDENTPFPDYVLTDEQLTSALHELSRTTGYRRKKPKKTDGKTEDKTFKDKEQQEKEDKDKEAKIQTAREQISQSSTSAGTESAKDKYISRFGDVKFHTISFTIFDAPYFKNSDVYGIYVLFWSGIGFFIFNSIVHYYFENKNSTVIWNWPIVLILRRDLLKVAFTDLAMYLTTYFVYFLQKGIKKGWYTWHNYGWLVQSVYSMGFFVFWMAFASERIMHFPWIARVFLVLHSLVFVMKMHSYGFYNGYLWKIQRELDYSRQYYKKLVNGTAKLPTGFDHEATKSVLEESIAFCEFELDSQAYASSVTDDGTILEAKHVVEFPNNITLFNFFEYSSYPTVVYTLNFPRTPKIRWFYVFEKVLGIFGIFFLMITVAQKWMYPIILQCKEARNLTGTDKFLKYILLSLDIMPPFLLEYLLTFFIIWDVILNAIAELSRFSDRDFYGPWWSCTDWSEFSRIWNKPVHKFLLRHVYHSSISALHLNKGQAALVTFLISSIVHELVMFVIFNNFRGYLLFLQMTQVPAIMLARTKLMRDQKILGNVICWVGFITAPSVITISYLMY